MSIGEKIKVERKKLGLTQTELGDKLNVKKNAVSKWECGRVEDIPASKIKAMAEIFNVSLSYLIDEDIDSKNETKKSNHETDLFELIEKTHGQSVAETFRLYLMLDTEDRAEIRGEIKHMLKTDKYFKEESLDNKAM